MLTPFTMATCNDLAPLAFTMLAAIGVTVPTVPVFSPPPLAFAPPGATSNVSAPPPVRSGPPAPPFDQRVAQVYDGQNSASQQRKEAALKGQVRISQKRKERDLSVFTSSLSVARFMGIEAEVSASKAGIVDVSTSLKVHAMPITRRPSRKQRSHAAGSRAVCSRPSYSCARSAAVCVLGAPAHRDIRGHHRNCF